MREILFRGISEATKTFVCGDLIKWDEKSIVICVASLDNKKVKDKHYINPETLGQFTGFYDEDGKRIFEGDIVMDQTGKIFEIKEYKGCWVIWDRKAKSMLTKWDYLNTFAETLKVIGNVHENPELLKEGAKNV